MPLGAGQRVTAPAHRTGQGKSGQRAGGLDAEDAAQLLLHRLLRRRLDGGGAETE